MSAVTVVMTIWTEQLRAFMSVLTCVATVPEEFRYLDMFMIAKNHKHCEAFRSLNVFQLCCVIGACQTESKFSRLS